MAHADFSISDGVARIELQRPDALNAVDTATKTTITETLRRYKSREDVRVVVFQSQGETFTAGGDIKEVREQEYSLSYFTETWEELFDAMTNLGKPTVARIDGYTLGGGFDLMLHTDIAVAAEDAKLGQPEVSLGIVNHFSPPILRESVGFKKTLDLMLTGETISGAEAERLGLVARSVPGDELDDEVDRVVESLKAKSPRVLEKLKQGLWDTLDKSPSATRAHLESVALESARVDPDYEEGVSAQLDGRDPEW